MKHLAVFAATSWERRAITRALPTRRVERVNGVTWHGWAHPSCFVAVIQTGVGPANARAACQAVADQRPWTAYLASGYAGALAPARIGDLVIPERVLDHAPAQAPARADAAPDAAPACHEFYRQMARDVAQSSGCGVLHGCVVTVETMVCLAREKQAIGRACGASGLDMESATIGAVAARHGIPFCVVRAISDLVEEDLPCDLALLCHPATRLRGMGMALLTPGIWPALNRLRRQNNAASARLTGFFETFFLRLAGA